MLCVNVWFTVGDDYEDDDNENDDDRCIMIIALLRLINNIFKTVF